MGNTARSRPKHKVGDILEWWVTGRNPAINTLMVMDIKKKTQEYIIYWGRRCTKRRRRCRKIYPLKVTHYEYVLKYLNKDVQLVQWDANIVDTKNIPRDCGVGWRKVG
jgi:hypothetical protein